MPEVDKIPESKTSQQPAIVSTVVACDLNLFNLFSNYAKLVRVVAYILRWKRNAITKTKESGVLSIAEINHATNCLIKIAHTQSFAQKMHELKNHGQVNKKSRILPLHPFLDDSQLLRVGGRIEKHCYLTKQSTLFC